MIRRRGARNEMDQRQQRLLQFIGAMVAWVAGVVVTAAALAQVADQESSMTPALPVEQAGNAEVERVFREFQGKGDLGDGSSPLAPEETLKQTKLAPGLKMEVVSAEPEVMQPLYLFFDPRGRLWVTEYQQYPFPAGIKIIRYDQYLRAVFDDVPRPPPNHVHGKDQIRVFEDADGDGKYDSSQVVISGLNIATAALTGDGGIWVLNPPYLLFYPDADGDGIPDQDPEVRLRGFGIEDTHAVANSLAWGPDGWLYGAMGSTTTANVSSAVNKNVKFEGQCIWRYHPRTEVFEVFAEGGGNTFSLEFDSTGQAFSGTNHGGTRGMFYPQGSYGEKNFGKHGPLTNPAAFGFFRHMGHEGDAKRFAQTFVIYEGGTLPSNYDGQVIAANALHHVVWASQLLPDRSTFRTVDQPVIADSSDHWFRPVDVKVGPDGAVYLADWYDTRLSHVDPRDTWHKTSGRIYRIQSESALPGRFPDLTQLSDANLIQLFQHANKWQRQTAVRVLAERLRNFPNQESTRTTLASLRSLLKEQNLQALHALWTLHDAEVLQEEELCGLLDHPQCDVRRWAVRLLGDSRAVSASTASALAELATSEPDVHVRSQLASSARRLSASAGLPILRALMMRDEDSTDPHLPLLIWWGLEAHCSGEPVHGDPQVGVPLKVPSSIESPRDQTLRLLADAPIWEHPIPREVIASRVMRRFAMEGIERKLEDPERQAAFAACQKLLEVAPADVQPLLMSGFLEAQQGEPLNRFPEGLQSAILEYQRSLGQSDLVLGVQLGQQDAVQKALQKIADEEADLSLRLKLIEMLGEIETPQSVPVLLSLLRSQSVGVRKAALHSLARYSNPEIGTNICRAIQSTLPETHGLREAALRVLASRETWGLALLNEIEQHRLSARDIPFDIVEQLRLSPSEEIKERVVRLWGKGTATTKEKQQEIERVRTLLQSAMQNQTASNEQLTAGKELFKTHCGNCHTLFSEGGKVGPNLTGYERSNLEFMLVSIIDPSAGIREEFTQFQLATVDGRILTGLVTDRSDRSVTIQDAKGHLTTVRQEDIDVLQAMTRSLMPDGLLEKLSDDQVVALFAYLMQPVPPSLSSSEK